MPDQDYLEDDPQFEPAAADACEFEDVPIGEQHDPWLWPQAPASQAGEPAPETRAQREGGLDA